MMYRAVHDMMFSYGKMMLPFGQMMCALRHMAAFGGCIISARAETSLRSTSYCAAIHHSHHSS